MAAPDWVPPSGEGDFLEIGRIATLRKEIDQAHIDNSDNVSVQMKKKMSIIDLIPCLFKVDYSSILETNKPVSEKFKPEILFQDACVDFASIQATYGLGSTGPTNYNFLRLYLTDMTSATDSMSNDYMKSVLDDSINSLTQSKVGQLFSKVQKTAQSTGSGDKNSMADNLKTALNSVGIKFVDGVLTSDTAQFASDILTHGSRISFPKIWNSGSYSPNLNCNVKLVSPYGHPKAINEFIIKPIAYLLILLSPTTKHGITTERPNYITLKSYGLSNLTLCYPRSIDIRRGGDDSSYNIYKQPLTVDVNLTFEAVTEGFACFKNFNGRDPSGQHPEYGIFTPGSEISLKKFDDDYDLPGALFPTLKSIVNSFRPFGYEATGSTSTPINTPSDSISQSSGTDSTNPVEEEITLDSVPTDTIPLYEVPPTSLTVI
jgi:hypothetical protein